MIYNTLHRKIKFSNFSAYGADSAFLEKYSKDWKGKKCNGL